MRRTSILLADDHTILLDALVPLLQQNFEVAGVAHDGHLLVQLAKSECPDVIVTDVEMPSLDGIDAMRVLRKEGCSAKFLFLTMHTDLPLLAQVMRAGASGFVLKICDAEELQKAIRCVAQGGTYITPLLAGDLIGALMSGDSQGPSEMKLTTRQREVLRLLAEGKTMKEAAALMGVSSRTAEAHKYDVMRQLGAQSTAALIRYAVRVKLV
jgi:DNA-binding NarL/FixJ family response regulator